jgi:hypothetical protein
MNKSHLKLRKAGDNIRFHEGRIEALLRDAVSIEDYFVPVLEIKGCGIRSPGDSHDNRQ